MFWRGVFRVLFKQQAARLCKQILQAAFFWPFQGRRSRVGAPRWLGAKCALRPPRYLAVTDLAASGMALKDGLLPGRRGS
jgi:hypothetical protein